MLDVEGKNLVDF